MANVVAVIVIWLVFLFFWLFVNALDSQSGPIPRIVTAIGLAAIALVLTLGMLGVVQ